MVMTVADVPASRSAATEAVRPLSAADVPELLRALGDIPADRVFLSPLPGTATEADVVRLVDGDRKVLCELIDPTLVEKTVGAHEFRLAALIVALLNNFVIPRNSGFCGVTDMIMRMLGGNVRLPDVCFIAWSDVPGGKLPKEPVGRFPVTLAIEVLSISNPKREMERKRKDYFQSGTRLVWEFDPEARAVAIYTSPENPQALDHTKVLDGGSVLPGFTMDLGPLFAESCRSAN